MNITKNKGSIVLAAVLAVALGALAMSLVLESRMNNLILSTNDLSADLEKSYGATYSPVGGKIYNLQNSITSTQTTINLVSFKDPVSNIAYTMNLLGSTIQYGTLEPENPNKVEFISFTGITPNADGTSQLTGVTRGLPGFNVVAGGCTASTTLQQSHGGQAKFILSNNPCQISEYLLKNYNDTITGYITAPTPLSNGDIAIKSYVDSIANGGAVSNAVIAVPGTAGETVASGTIVYLKQADARWYKAASTIAEASSSPIGISQGNGTAGNAIASGVLLAGYDSNQSALSPGVNYFLGTTAGSPSTATTTRVIGRARDTTTIYVGGDFLIQNIFFWNNLFYGNNTFYGSTTQSGRFNITAATTTFVNAATSSVKIASSSLDIGAFPADRIGKNWAQFMGVGTSTFQIPLGVRTIWIKATGGGGGGGGSDSATIIAGGGGGGACVEGPIDVTGTTTMEIVIGDGGAGNTTTGSGTAGQHTKIGYTVNSGLGFYATAKGGGGGGGSAAGGTNGAGGATTTASMFEMIGGAGGQGGTTASGSTFGIPGGATCFGSNTNWDSGNFDAAPGNGGPAAGTNVDGGKGSPGGALIRW